MAKVKAGLTYNQVAKLYRVGRGAIAAVVYRHRHGPTRLRTPRAPFFTAKMFVWLDEGMLAEIDAVRRPGESRCSAVRSLIEWGLEACAE